VKLDWDRGTVSGAWDEPDADARAVLILAHGAGGDLNDGVLRGVARALADEGLAVLRFNFPYRESGRRAPGAQKESEECYRAVADGARRGGCPLYLGGKSYGGRIASHIVSDGFSADALIFLSYPLHAPGRPEKLRDAHLHDITAPMLFVQGTRDSFARGDLLDKTLRSLPSAEHVPVDGGDHSLRVRGRSASDVAAEIAQAVNAFTR
jgi:predicted alpha/beta-hydrolase family hydrolase